MRKVILIAGLSLASLGAFAADDLVLKKSIEEMSPSMAMISTDILQSRGVDFSKENLERYIHGQDGEVFVFLSALNLSCPHCYSLASAKLKSLGTPFTVANFKTYLDSQEFTSDLIGGTKIE